MFSHNIEPKPEYLRRFKSNNIRWEIISYIKQQVDTILGSEDVSAYNCLLRDVYEICENIRTSNITLAHEMYRTLFYELTGRTYTDSKKGQREITFCQTLDFTEVYYNWAKLKWDSGDYDDSLLFIVHADVEYSKHNCEPRCTFIKFLLNNSKGYVLWNIIPHLHSDFSNYKRRFNISRLKEVIGREITQDFIKELLNDFEMLLLLQFINSANRYHNFSSEKSNEYKTLREFRILGELSWLFECYLKDRYKVSNKQLYNVIQKYLFADRKELLSQFSKYDNPNVPKEAKQSKEYQEESLEFLFNELENKSDPVELTAICIRITYLFRNYSSHNVEDKFFTFNKDNRSKELYMVILSSFLIAFVLINPVNK